jgi:hypothetical protein
VSDPCGWGVRARGRRHAENQDQVVALMRSKGLHTIIEATTSGRNTSDEQVRVCLPVCP